jgi:hypothetical protein
MPIVVTLPDGKVFAELPTAEEQAGRAACLDCSCHRARRGNGSQTAKRIPRGPGLSGYDAKRGYRLGVEFGVLRRKEIGCGPIAAFYFRELYT